MCKITHTSKAYDAITQALEEGQLTTGWEDVNLVKFGMSKATTAMYMTKHNKKLHQTAIVDVRNVWSINEKVTNMTQAQKIIMGYEQEMEEDPTLEQMWWNIAAQLKYDIRGMVVRKGVLQITTTRARLDETVGFAIDLVRETARAFGMENFAKMVSSFNPNERQPYLDERPSILEGNGKMKIDTNHFTEEEFKKFASNHGIHFQALEITGEETKTDDTRPPRATYYKPGREPVERDPNKLREGAGDLWKKFTEPTTTTQMRNNQKKMGMQVVDTPTEVPTISPRDNIVTSATKSRITTLEKTIKDMKDSQK